VSYKIGDKVIISTRSLPDSQTIKQIEVEIIGEHNQVFIIPYNDGWVVNKLIARKYNIDGKYLDKYAFGIFEHEIIKKANTNQTPITSGGAVCSGCGQHYPYANSDPNFKCWSCKNGW